MIEEASDDMPGAAMIRWDETGTPIAARFDDPYFSRRDGRAETRHVFIAGNDLTTRFLAADRFHIAELGFGTGLNFLETLLHWKAYARLRESPPPHLVYTAFERYPLSHAACLQALSHWPDLLTEGGIFLKEIAAADVNREMRHGSVTLRLIVGDANVTIDGLTQPVDAWYLDGFSPAKNPELWNESLMRAVAEKTMPGGTFATYTAAGWVRRMLAGAGFRVTRTKGYGTKRHMSTGIKQTEDKATASA